MLTDVIEQYETTNVDGLKRFALTVITIPFYTVGWLAGIIVFTLRWVWASIKAGYRNGLATLEAD